MDQKLIKLQTDLYSSDDIFNGVNYKEPSN